MESLNKEEGHRVKDDKMALVEATIKEGIEITKKDLDIVEEEELVAEASKDEEAPVDNEEEVIVDQEKKFSQDEKPLEISNEEVRMGMFGPRNTRSRICFLLILT